MSNKPVNSTAQSPAKKPYDVAQMTILMDNSASMRPYVTKAREALERVVSQAAGKDGLVLAIRSFDTKIKTLTEFEIPAVMADRGGVVPYSVEGGGTAIARCLADAVDLSRRDAHLVPDMNVHHVFVVITDGEDLDSRAEDIDRCKREISRVDVDATFILIDFSGGDACAHLGLKSIPAPMTPRGFDHAMDQVSLALGTIADNIVNELPPQTNLLLPPAR